MPTTSTPYFTRGWGPGLLLLLAALALLAGLALFLLDPWLKRSLERQVSTRTHGQYQLQIGRLRTHLWRPAIELDAVDLRPTARPLADTLPRLHLRLAHFRVSGLGFVALLRHRLVPIDNLTLDSLRLNVLALPRRPGRHPSRPLHQRLPVRLPGLQIGQISLVNSRLTIGPAAAPTLRLPAADLRIRDLLLSAAGAADTQRLAYAAAWQLRLAHPSARAAGHVLAAEALFFSTQQQLVQLDSVRVRPPSASYQPGAVRLRLALPRLRLTGLRAAALQHGRQLRADSLLFTNPTLTLWPPAQPPPPLWQLLAPVLAGVQLQAAAVRNATLRVAGLEHAPMAQAVTINARHLRVDAAASADRRRILYAQSWTAHTGQLSATFDAPFYRAAVQHLRLNTTTKSLSLAGIRLTPAFSPAQMNRRKGHQASAISIRLPELTAQGFDFPLLAHTNQVQARLLTVHRPWVLIASDGRGPINPARSVITPEAVRRVPLRFAVQRLDIAGGNLYTRYRSPRSPIVGTLAINRFQGSLFNLSNDPARQTTATPLTGHATAWLQNRSRLDVRVAIPLLDPLGRHRLQGSFGPAPFAILNPMTAPTRFLRFDRGNLHLLRFAMQADQQGIRGIMQAEYTGLKLSLLGYKNGELKQPLLKKVVSKAANALVIRDDNPRHGRLVPGQTTSQRERRFAVFVLWRQGLISGLLNSVGVPQKLAQKLSEGKDQGPLPE